MMGFKKVKKKTTTLKIKGKASKKKKWKQCLRGRGRASLGCAEMREALLGFSKYNFPF